MNQELRWQFDRKKQFLSHKYLPKSMFLHHQLPPLQQKIKRCMSLFLQFNFMQQQLNHLQLFSWSITLNKEEMAHAFSYEAKMFVWKLKVLRKNQLHIKNSFHPLGPLLEVLWKLLCLATWKVGQIILMSCTIVLILIPFRFWPVFTFVTKHQMTFVSHVTSIPMLRATLLWRCFKKLCGPVKIFQSPSLFSDSVTWLLTYPSNLRNCLQFGNVPGLQYSIKALKWDRQNWHLHLCCLLSGSWGTQKHC